MFNEHAHQTRDSIETIADNLDKLTHYPIYRMNVALLINVREHLSHVSNIVDQLGQMDAYREMLTTESTQWLQERLDYYVDGEYDDEDEVISPDVQISTLSDIINHRQPLIQAHKLIEEVNEYLRK